MINTKKNTNTKTQAIETIISDLTTSYNLYCDLLDQNEAIQNYLCTNLKSNKTTLFSMNLTHNYDCILVNNFKKNIAEVLELNSDPKISLSLDTNTDNLEKTLKEYVEKVFKKFNIHLTLDEKEIKYTSFDLIQLHIDSDEEKEINTAIQVIDDKKETVKVLKKKTKTVKVEKELTLKEKYNF